MPSHQQDYLKCQTFVQLWRRLHSQITLQSTLQVINWGCIVVFSGRLSICSFDNSCLFPSGGGSYTLKLAFSPSSSISPTAPTVAPAVAAAAVAVSNGANPLGPIGSPVHPRCMAGSPISIVTNGVKELNGDTERNGLSPEHLTSSSP